MKKKKKNYIEKCIILTSWLLNIDPLNNPLSLFFFYYFLNYDPGFFWLPLQETRSFLFSVFARQATFNLYFTLWYYSSHAFSHLF